MRDRWIRSPWPPSPLSPTGSCGELGPDIQWIHSYVVDDKIFCLYQATGEDIIREHGRCGGFPVDAVHEVHAVIDPATAELIP